LNYPQGVAVDGAGNIYIADTSNERVRKVSVSTKTIATIAGTGNYGYGGDGNAATSATLALPSSVAVDNSGYVYIADTGNNRIRKITGTTISTVAGSNTACSSPTATCGDNAVATSAQLKFPNGVTVDSSGNIYIGDTSDNRIRKVTGGTISTVAGNGTACSSATAACGDGGAAKNANLGYPWGVAVDSSGNIYIADSNDNRIRKVTAAGAISTIAGNGTACPSSTAACGDGGGATSAGELNGPEDVAVDSSGNIYIADTLLNRIRAVNSSSSGPPPPALPVFSLLAGRYLTPQTVTISDTTSGAAIYFTIDGSTPTASSTQYTGPISVGFSETINAIAILSSAGSGVATTTYIIGSAPTFSPIAGTYTNVETVSITSPDFGAAIYYTTDGTTPTTSATRYTIPISVSSTETLKAIAVLGAASSSVATATYTINLSSSASSTATITVNGSEQTGDSNTITVSFNGLVETVTYGPYSTPASIASAFGAKFSNDYLHAGLCAHASGAVITFKLKGAAPFATLDVEGSTASFQLQGSGFATQVAKNVDTGTVTLTVAGVVAAQTSYGDGATSSSIAEGLAAGVTSNSLVNITAVDDTLNLQAKQVGAGTNYSYTLQTASWDSMDFSQPSFAYPAINGNLSGGANAGSGSGGGQQTVYSYSIPSYVSGQTPTGYDALGNIVGYSDSVMGTWSMSGGYDPLNRLTAASATSGPYSGLQISWGLDPFGNRTSEAYSGSSGVSVPTSSTVSYTATANNPTPNNRISSTSLGTVNYDAAGDVTQDNQNQYLYDGDGRLCAVRNLMFGTMTGYVYGADGMRVSTGTIATWGSCDPSVNGYQAIKDSIPDSTGGQLTETGLDANGNVAWAHTNVRAGGQLIATYDANGLHYYLNDWNGSRRVQTDYEGVVEQTCTNLPYGNGETCSATPTEELYAGLERDSAAGLDNAMYRSYASAFGRWTTPDPYDGSYDLTNPQSLDRYAYVNGMPLVMIDPNGQFPCDPSGLPTVGVDPVTGVFTMTVTCAAPFIAEANAIPYVGLAVDIGALVYDLGKDLGWWGQKPQFKGNVKASQNGKNVPNTSKNPCTCFDTGAFAETLDNNAMQKSIGRCAKYVRMALEGGGIVTTGRPNAAGNYGPFLQQKGFSPVSMNGYVPQTGDIDVFDITTQHPYGHITGYDGNEWVSDFFQPKGANPYAVKSSAGNSTIYRNSCPCN
jgi:RHS repeat-associated protein